MKKIVISYLFFLFLACCHWTGNICRAQSVFANPGTITGDQTIDANTQAQRIKNSVLPYCNVPYTFSWEYCWEDYYLSGFWSPIPGATSEYYDPGVVSRSTYYRRAINYTEGFVTKKAYSNEVLVKVRDTEVTLTPGTISGNQTVESSTQPARLESVVAASASSGFYTIMWQSAPASSGPWSDISGTSGSQSYQPGPLSATTYFRRTITSSTSKQASSNVVCVAVVTTSPGSISGNQKIEKGAQPTVLSNSTSPSFSGGSYSLSWESAASASGPWTKIAGATGVSYQPGALTATTWFRRVTTSATKTAYSNTVCVTVVTTSPGTISGEQTIETGASPTVLQSVADPSATDGSGTVSWESSLNGDQWSAIAGTTGQMSYQPGTLTQSTWFRRVFRSSTKTVYSNSVWVETVATTPGSIDGNQTIEISTQPRLLQNVSLANTVAATHSYFWQSAPASSGPWQTISGAAETSYQPGPLTATTYFRRGVTTPGTTVYSNIACVTVVTTSPGSISGDQKIEKGAQPTVLSNSTSPSFSGGSYSLSWESAASASGPWTKIAGATGVSYQPGALTATTWFRRVTTSATKTAYSNTVCVTVVTTSPGTISGEQTIETGASPTVLQSVADPSATDGSGTVSWESSLNGDQWSAIAGTTGQMSYQPGTLTQSTWFRRVFRSSTKTVYSNSVWVETVATTPGSIDGNQTIEISTQPRLLQNVSLANTVAATHSYFWQSAPASSGPWQTISGAAETSYQPGPLTATTYFRRGFTTSVTTVYSNIACVTVVTTSPGSISGDQKIEKGAQPTVLSNSTSPSFSGGSYSLSWESAASASGPWTKIAGATGVSYQPGALTATTWFRRVTTSATKTAYSNTVCVTVVTTSPGSISGQQTIETGARPAILQSVADPSATDGSGTISWESSLNGDQWSAISGTTGQMSYQPGTLTQSTWFRRVFRSSTKTVYSNSVWVETVATTPGSIDGDQTIAASVQPAVLPNVSLAMTAATESSYFWQSAPASSGPWQTISGAAETSYRPGPLTVTTYFRRGFTTPITTVYSNTVCVTVVTVEPGSISGDQTVEDSQQPARLESLVDPSVSSGSYTLSWESSDDGTQWSAIPEASDVSYQPEPLSATTYFRRVVVSQVGRFYSNVVCVTVPMKLSDENYIQEYTPLTETFDSQTPAPNQCMRTVRYFDGLGRPVQSIAIGAAPGYGDLASLQTYDQCGRESRSWLPASLPGNNGAYVAPATLETQARTSNLGDTIPYSEIRYEASPLGRPVERYGPGAQWREAGKAQRISYLTNTASGELRCARIVSGSDRQTLSLSRSGDYPAGELHVTGFSDEDGRLRYEFRDKAGQLLLTRSVADSEFFDTYYVYDCFGNLRAVFPPEASAQLPASGTIDPTSDFCTGLGYFYRYDVRNRCIGKKLPGAEEILYVYDDADQLVFTQDGEQRSRGEWSFALSDGLGRKAVTGICTGMSGSQIAPGCLEGKTLKAVYGADGPLAGYALSCEEGSCTLTGASVLSADYYDGYDFMERSGFEALAYSARDGYGQWSGSDGARSLRTGSLTARLGTDESTPLGEAYYYDFRHRLVQSVASNHLGGVSRYSYRYDFTGNPLGVREEHSPGAGSAPDVLVTAFAYDHAGRLQSATASLNDGAPGSVSYGYDALGQLSSRQFGPGDGVLTETCAYNVRGWLAEQNSDKFGMKLRYQNPALGGAARYSGDISEWEWQHKEGDHPVDTYAFAYDGLGRLLGATHYEGTAAADRYTEKGITYDRNGNILTLSRHTGGVASDYCYAYDGNRLLGLAGASSLCEYDANGNMKKDAAGGLRFNYNLLNLLQEVTGADDTPKAKYAYSADGVKLSVSDGTSSFGYEYSGSLIYVRTNGSLSLDRALFDGGTVRPNGAVDYFVKDHLGSVRVIVDQAGTVREQNDYYPYGERCPENTYAVSSVNRYKFNGKEEQTVGDLGMLDYGARMYQAGIGRWFVPDPLAEQNPSVSLYAYCSNNPINRIDLDGLSDDWVERFNEQLKKTQIAFDENVTSADDPDLRKGDRYLGKAVVVFEGSRNEKLGKGDNLFGEGANLADVTVYGPNGPNDIQTYKGYTMSSDPEKYGVVADGEYDVQRIGPNEKKGPYQSEWTLNNRGEVPAMDNYNPAYPERDPAYLIGVFIHRSNNNGWAGRKWNDVTKQWNAVSKGCLLILPNQWDRFNNQLKRVNTLKLQLKR